MVQQQEAPTTPRWRSRAAGARARISRAAARLQKALLMKNPKKPIDYSSLLAEHRNTILELRAQYSTIEKKYEEAIQTARAEIEEQYNMAEEERATLCVDIRSLKDSLEQLREEISQREEPRAAPAEDQQTQKTSYKIALLSAEVESLKTVLDLKTSEVDKERRVVEQLRQVGTDLAAAQQRAQSAQSRVDHLRTELERKHCEEGLLNDKNGKLEEGFSEMEAKKTHKLTMNTLRHKELWF